MLKFLFLLGVALQPFQAMGQVCGLCPKGFTYFKLQNKCYKAFSTKLSWDDALRICGELDSHLVTITSSANKDPLNQVIGPIKASCINPDVKGPAFWTAGRRKCSKGPFTWVPNRGIKMEMLYTNWNQREPNNVKGIEDCVHFLARDKNLLWNDSRCWGVDCFVCEVDL